jgi:hypothetical protein
MVRLRRRHDEAGQGIVEFALVIPVFMVILLGMLEFGFVFDHALTVQYAAREGARVGSAVVNGGGSLGCNSGESPNASTVDPLIIQAVVRVLDSPGSRVNLAEIPEIRLYKADASGSEATYSAVNVYTRSGATYVLSGSPGWSACSRSNAGSPPDSIGVSLVYTYRFQTALGSVLSFFGGAGLSSITFSDRAVMAMNPTN